MPPSEQPNYVRQLREAVGEARGVKFTQAMFAKELGVSVSLINALETKASRPISNDLDRRFVMNYGVSVLRALYVDANREAIIKINDFHNERLRESIRESHQKEEDFQFEVMLDGLRCNANQHAPLVEALRLFFAQRTIMEAAACGAIDIDLVGHINCICLAAKKKGCAAILYQMLKKACLDLPKELGISQDDIDEASDRIKMNGGSIPDEEIRTDEAALELLFHRFVETRYHRQHSASPAPYVYDETEILDILGIARSSELPKNKKKAKSRDQTEAA